MDELVKDGAGVTDIGYYKELLFRKVDNKSDAIVRSMKFDGIKHGQIIVVGIDEFAIKDPDGQVSRIRFDEILDIQ
jgi:hypothetical protein